MTRLYRQYTAMRAIVHQHEAWTDREPSVFEISMDIVGANLTKNMGQACGGCTLNLVPRREYLTEIRNNDWIEVFLDTEVEPSKVPYMVVSVDRVARSRHTDAKGAVKTSIRVTCRDYGKVFLDTVLIYDPIIAAQLDPIEFATSGLLVSHGSNGLKVFARPDEILSALLDKYHDRRIQCLLPFSLQDKLTGYAREIRDAAFQPTSFGVGISIDGIKPHVRGTGTTSLLGIPRRGGELIDQLDVCRGLYVLDSMPNLSGNLWGTMAMFSNPILNALWVDTEKGIPTIHLREQPFSHDDFAHLEAVSIDATEVTQEELASSENDTKNWFRVFPDSQYITPEIATVAGIGNGSPLSVQRAGIRKMEACTHFFGTLVLGGLADSHGGPNTTLLQAWSETLAEWYYPNEQFLSGIFVSRLRPDLHVGQRLDYTNERTDEELSFYIEGVSHSFIYPGASSTTISVTRGVERVNGRYPLLKTFDELKGELPKLDLLIKQARKTTFPAQGPGVGDTGGVLV